MFAEVSGGCDLFSQLFYDLLPKGVDQTASAICTSGCDNFNEALSILETCKSYVANLPEDLDAACSAYRQFRTCLYSSDVPLTCPMFGALMDVLYPQHIFGLYEEQCNDTRADQDTCGEKGVAKMDHCLRVLALAWPASTDTPVLSMDQCSDFRSALRCLESSGFNECPSLQLYFSQRTADKRKHKEILERGCADLPELQGGDSSAAKVHLMSSQAAAFTSLVTLLAAVVGR
ncbi:uncharacterized protein LOC112562369 [Pomacea canaliculata]|uniref:uncharacterized protein LOC112562369 n=1 Tax=Pomacea canaliculata TaxID=400727 RepID=UPI000D7355C6|nr:uncharacterized protein LOC112562369 [Pomacea canaliculata]